MPVKPITAREAALRALGAYRRDGAWPDRSLGGIAERSEMTARDAALASRILSGVMQNLSLLDYYISGFSNMKKIEPQVLDILRISIYQLAFMDIPPSAAVNEGVKLAKKRANPHAAGFVNAVLRKVADAVQNRQLPELTTVGELERLAILYSHPEWLVRELCGTLGSDGVEAFLSANNADNTPVTAQVNTLITNTDELLRTLEKSGVSAERHEWLEDCLQLCGAGNIERLEVFSNGHFYVQDAAAKLAVMAAGVKQGDFVLDGCAAPGGKSFAAAIAMGDRGEVIACDIHENKLRHIEGGTRRLGLNIIKAQTLDASVRTEEYAGVADVVIADVPCSGFGVIRKKPEIRYKSQEDIAGLPDIQKRILYNLSSYVRPGGVLIYSTCTVLQRENEDVAKWFISNNNNFEQESFTLPGVGTVSDGMITLWPQVHGTDGFFICKLRRKA